MRRRVPFGLTIVCAVALALLIGLGSWQVQRLQWKQGLIARADAAVSKPPLPLDQVAYPNSRRWEPRKRPQLADFQRVLVSCYWRAEAYVELRSIHNGQPGVRIISVCERFLVDRGFIPDTVTARPIRMLYAIRPAPERPIVAQARNTPPPGSFTPPPEGRVFYARDNRAIAEALGADPDYLGKQVLFAEETTAPEVPQLIAEAPPPAFSNNHLGYALTWFGLALAVIAFYIVLLRRRLRTGTPAKDTEESST